MKTIPWKNKTKKHPNGVCEAATSIWLEKISNQNISSANKITPDECDVLQSQVEAGTYTWAVDLINLLKPGSTFNPFSGPTIANPVQMLTALTSMSNGDFFYLSATNPHGGGHAVAVFKAANNFYFFDPNYAIYSCDSSTVEVALVANQIMHNLAPWSSITIAKGSMT